MMSRDMFRLVDTNVFGTDCMRVHTLKLFAVPVMRNFSPQKSTSIPFNISVFLDTFFFFLLVGLCLLGYQ